MTVGTPCQGIKKSMGRRLFEKWEATVNSSTSFRSFPEPPYDGRDEVELLKLLIGHTRLDARISISKVQRETCPWCESCDLALTVQLVILKRRK